jgi:O-methyltransferase
MLTPLSRIDGLASQNNKMMSVDALANIYWGLSHLLELGVPGDIVELGCHAGGTSVFLKLTIDHLDPQRTLHVYDSFEGLPPARGIDGEFFAEGDLRTSISSFLDTFSRLGIEPPVIHPGWFQKVLPSELPEVISFALLDGDFFESILVSLKHVWPRVAKGGIIMIDDYCDPAQNPRAWDKLPGVKAACDEFFADRADQPVALVASGDMALAYVRKTQ